MGIGLGHLHHSLRVSVPLEINISLRRKVVKLVVFITELSLAKVDLWVPIGYLLVKKTRHYKENI